MNNEEGGEKQNDEAQHALALQNPSLQLRSLPKAMVKVYSIKNLWLLWLIKKTHTENNLVLNITGRDFAVLINKLSFRLF